MRLEKELVRKILLAIEASEGSPYEGVELEIDGWTQDQIGYHVMLLAEANYLIAEDLGGIGDDLAWEAQRLTFAGHEFLDTIRDVEVWRRTKEAAGRAGGVSLQVMVEIGKAYAKQVLQERTGIVLP
jgi:hypothetical protein